MSFDCGPTRTAGCNSRRCRGATSSPTRRPGFIATETGAGYTWTVNSRENRLTHWRNDPVCDPHSEAFYLRDRDGKSSGRRRPVPPDPTCAHEVRYGFGYARVRSDQRARLTQARHKFVPQRRPGQDHARCRSQNNERRPRAARRVLLCAPCPGQRRAGGRASRCAPGSTHESQTRVRHERSRGNLPAASRSSSLVIRTPTRPPAFTCDREEFLGRHGDLSAPAAVS